MTLVTVLTVVTLVTLLTVVTLVTVVTVVTVMTLVTVVTVVTVVTAAVFITYKEISISMLAVSYPPEMHPMKTPDTILAVTDSAACNALDIN